MPHPASPSSPCRRSRSFRPDCPTPFDCKGDEQETADFPAAPVVDYTARDYDTIRKLLLDRLALTTPDWVERNPADLGVTMQKALKSRK